MTTTLRTRRALPNHTDRDSVSFRHRSSLTLLTLINGKTPKGEKAGYLSAILYLAPHTSGGGATLCPYSTEACREMCLAGAGLGALPRQVRAKQWRTDLWNDYRKNFISLLERDIERLRSIAEVNNLTPALRLNGTSDILWERELPSMRRWDDLGVRIYDYTKVPLHMRRPPPGYHLTYSVGGPEDMERAVGYLAAGHSVAVVVPEDAKHDLVGQEVDVGARTAGLIDGDLTDLRFLDPPGSVVLLKPKGRARTDLMRPAILHELRTAARAVRA